MIIGLSGTGKTTTTFTTQNDSLPVQDDFVALMPGGKVYGTENGCFAKTFALDPDFEPNDLQRRRQAHRVPRERLPGRRRQGRLLRTSLHAERPRGVPHGRPRSAYEDARERRTGRLPPDPQPEREHHPGRREARQEQAAAYFMLGETTGTRAGGAAEAGKFLRVPGDESVLPAAARPAGQPDARAAGHAPDGGLPDEHRPRRRQGRRRPLEEGEDPALVGRA